jgi:hypothetical protein
VTISNTGQNIPVAGGAAPASITGTGNTNSLPSLTSTTAPKTNPLIGALGGAAVGAMINNALKNNPAQKPATPPPIKGTAPVANSAGNGVLTSIIKAATNPTKPVATTPPANTATGGVPPVGPDIPPSFVPQADGTYTNTNDDGSVDTYSADGTWQSTSYPVTDNNSGLGNGTQIPSESPVGDTATQTPDTSGITDLGDGFTENADGVVYDADGNQVATRRSDGTYALTSEQDNNGTVNLGGGFFQDQLGDIYKDDGTLYATSNGSGGYDLYTPYQDVPSADPFDSSSPAPADNTPIQDYPDIQYIDDSLPPDTSNEDNSQKNGGLVTMMKNGGTPHYAGGGGVISTTDDGSGNRIVLYGDGSTETYDSYDNLIDSTSAPDDASAYPNATQTPPANDSPAETNATQTPQPTNQGIPNAGSGDTSWLNNLLANVTGGTSDISGFLNTLKSNLGTIGGGALVGSLLTQLANSSGSSGAINKGVDMSKAAYIAPRTTNFGIGAAPVVSADQYTQPSTTKVGDVGDLYSNLGVTGYDTTPAAPPAQKAMAEGGTTGTHYTYGQDIDPLANMGLRQQPSGLRAGGGAHTLNSHETNPMREGRIDFRHGSSVSGEGDGQSDDIPAMLADGEYVIDAELVAMLGNGSNKAGSKMLDKFREEVRAHKRGADLKKIPPKAKSPLAYFKEANKNG